VRPAAEARGISLDVSLDDGGEPATGDVDRLQQVAWNLLSNAVKFTPPGGHVSVRLSRIEDQLELLVADDGQGIEPAFLPHVFERFRQADGSMTRQHGGLGLGLAIVRHLIELHGGTIRAESEGKGKGAAFRVRLPARAPGSSTRALSAPPSAPSAPDEGGQIMLGIEGLRVLVVDDEPDARELLVSLLEHCQAEVRSAATAAEALDALASMRPDVVVSDIAMPGMDGYALIRAIRALPGDRGGRTPAIALTAFDRIEDRRRALLEGFSRHVAKPVEPGELVAALARLAGRPAITER
jgi:CheY-like chemotaxis protein